MEATAESHALVRARISACDILRNHRALAERGGRALDENESLRRRASKALEAWRQRAPQDSVMQLSPRSIAGIEKEVSSRHHRADHWPRSA